MEDTTAKVVNTEEATEIISCNELTITQSNHYRFILIKMYKEVVIRKARDAEFVEHNMNKNKHMNKVKLHHL